MSGALAPLISHDAMKKDNTERPETLEVGSNVLAGTDPEKILECTRAMIQTFEKFDQNAALKWANPFGDGTTGERIVGILREQL